MKSQTVVQTISRQDELPPVCYMEYIGEVSLG